MSRQSLLRRAALGFTVAAVACGGDSTSSSRAEDSALAALWNQGRPAFGIFVPNERPPTPEQRRNGERPPAVYTVEGARRLAANPLLDYVFLNLEGGYDSAAVRAMADGLADADSAGGITLLVRIPSIADAGAALTRERVRQILDSGAGGVVFPHVQTPEQARMAIGFFADAGANVWSPTNPDGSVIAMIMIEDPEAVARAAEFADVPGYSVLACGIGSLTRAMGGDRAAAEAENLRVLEEARRVGRPDMITASSQDIEPRIRQGFLGLLMQGPTADEAIRLGRTAAGRID